LYFKKVNSLFSLEQLIDIAFKIITIADIIKVAKTDRNFKMAVAIAE
jgi:hypothetical protein